MKNLKQLTQALLVTASSLVFASLSPSAHAETLCAQGPAGGLPTALDCTESGTTTANGTLTTGALIAGPGVATNFTGAINGKITGTITTGTTPALSLEASDGIVFVHSGKLETTGNAAIGTYAKSQDANLDLTVGDVITRGTDAVGISASGKFNAKITCGNVSATGAGAAGVRIFSSFGGAARLADIRSDATGLSVGIKEGIFSTTVGNITTTGDGGEGFFASASDGGIGLTCGNITTSGRQAAGLYTTSSDGAVTINCGDVTTSGSGSPGAIITSDGRASFAKITTTGDNATGIYAGNFYGVNVKVGSISTAGQNSNGASLDLTSGARIEVGNVQTRGNNSYGIVGEGGDFSSVVINAGTIMTQGAGSIGIALTKNFTTGNFVNSGQITTSGKDAHGIVIENRTAETTAIDLSLSGVAVTGSGADAIQIGLGQTDGPAKLAVNLTTTGSITSADGTAIRIETTETLPFTLAEGLTVSGRTGGFVARAGSAALSIAGTIRAVAGPAIQLTGGPATIDIAASGAVEGPLVLGEGADTVTNNGLFAASGESNFGGGADLFINTGRMTAFGTAPVTLAQLETFRNSGTIDMANGFAGNRLQIGGAFQGDAGSRVLLDVSSSLDKADVLAVTGPITGQTTVVVSFVPSAAPINTGGIKLIEGAASSADAFTIEGLDQFDLFKLAISARGDDLFIAPALDPRATDLAVLASAVPDTWFQSFDAIRAATAGRGTFLPRLGLWTQAYGGNDRSGTTSTVNALGSTLAASNRLDVDRYGAQVGFDASAGRVLVGITAGYERTRGNAGLASRITNNGWNIGAYAAIGSLLGGYATATVKHDWMKIDFSIPGSTFVIPRLSARAIGADLEAGWRLSAGPISVDLGGGASVVRSSIDAFAASASTQVSPGDTTTARLRAGGRIGLSGPFAPYVDFRGLHSFAPSGSIALAGGAAALQFDTPGRGSWLRAEAGLSSLSGKLTAAAWVEAGDRKGWGVRAGMKF